MFLFLRLVFVGLFIGWLARWFYPGTVQMGLLGTIVLGIAGSLMGGFIAQLFTRRTDRPLEPAGCLSSVLGGMLVIFLGRALDLF